jgi:Uncharacterized conserved domain (SAYSvFN)
MYIVYRLLDAGPLMVIVTALAAIFTVGLGDNADGQLSAYSVFNRGFQQLLGSIDVDDLVNQHVGGGMMMAGAAGRLPPAGVEPHHHDNHPHPRNAARDPRNHFPDQIIEDDDDHDDALEHDETDNEQLQQQQQHHRKAGKKARRRNLEERQEQRRQREIARAMGLDGTGGDQEMMAMQRLIEEQIIANNNN